MSHSHQDYVCPCIPPLQWKVRECAADKRGKEECFLEIDKYRVREKCKNNSLYPQGQTPSKIIPLHNINVIRLGLTIQRPNFESIIGCVVTYNSPFLPLLLQYKKI